MSRSKINISPREIRELYVNKRLSCRKVALLLNCTDGTIINRMREFSIPTRKGPESKMRYIKKPFSNNLIEKAYLIGFRLGDLNIYNPKAKNTETIIARCHTTQSSQLTLVKRLFEKYGHITISCSQYGYNINCYLNQSFSFLLPKKLPNFIMKTIAENLAFIAGYIDAEGSFQIGQGRGRFKLDSYDKEILDYIHTFLSGNNYQIILRQIATKGSTNKQTNNKWNSDLWRININESVSLYNFINAILPYLRHSGRIKAAKKVLANIEQRRIYGTIKC